MADARQITLVEFLGRARLFDLARPVQDAFAAELGLTALLDSIRGM